MARGATIQVDEEDIPFEEEVQKNRYSLKGWIRYLEHKNTASCRVRNLTHDRALKALPVTQHKRIWNIYLPWAMSTDIPETSQRIFRRGLKIDETLTEDFVNFLLQIEHYAEAAELLANAVNDPKFKSKQGSSSTSISFHF